MAEFIYLENISETPWKNGGGKTQELIRIPHPLNSNDFIFRISIAQVEASGHFSFFPEIDRILMLLKGSGLLLKMQSQQILLNQPLSPIQFKGEEEIKAEILSGTIQDFNVMTHRKWGQSKILISDLAANDEFLFENERPAFLFIESGELSSDHNIYKAGCLISLKPHEKLSILAKSTTTIIQVIFCPYDKPIP